MDGEDDTILLHQVEIDMEKVDTTGEEEEYPSNGQGDTIKGNKKKKVANCSPEIIDRIILPVPILHISEDFCVWSVESSDKAKEISKRDDDLKAFTNNKNLDTLHQFFNIFFSWISFCSECLDDKVKVDEKINSKKDVDGEISRQATNTDRKEDCVVGDGLGWSLLFRILKNEQKLATNDQLVDRRQQ